ncbi:MAG TPA: peptidylprolyl isomerase [Gammaproteobacteria bacterium]|jgi:peptidyl-prolyl cis-trans isomerase A (cyclophilin A)|nr:peptidylprolyl isomerase [Gammaproteobacteria bacterium]
MRASLTALLSLTLLVACGQAPVKPAASNAPPAAATTPPPALTVTPPPQVQAPAPAGPPPVQEVPVDKDHREVLIHTNLGDIRVQLDATRAPLTVKHFLTYIKERYYDGSAFYRVIPGFVIQAGDYAADLSYHPQKHKPVPFESSALTNLRGSIAMAHDQDPNSANAAFFIDLQDNTQQFIPYAGNPGYAVFGQVVAGMDVVDKVAAVPTHSVTLLNAPAPYDDVPVKPVKVLKVTLLPMPPAGKP